MRREETPVVSPTVMDMIVDVRAAEMTVDDDASLLSSVDGDRSYASYMTLDDVSPLPSHDPTFQFQRIENDLSLAMAYPDSAHIFPSVKCIGIYEWLDRPGFNRLALSRDVHLNFGNGTLRTSGGERRRKTQQKFAIRPLRPANGYATSTVADVECYKIDLELVLNDQSIGDPLLARLGKNAVLHKNSGRSDGRWTIDGADVRVYHPKGRQISLTTEEIDTVTPPSLLRVTTCIPGVENINQCWSNSPTNLYSVEAAEILEKCLLWNYHNALESWSL